MRPGFVDDPARGELAIALTRITFPYILCMSMVALSAGILNTWSRTVGEGPLASVEGKSVLAFLNGNGPVSAYWVKKYHVLSGFYRFALARGLVSSVPLPGASVRVNVTSVGSSLA